MNVTKERIFTRWNIFSYKLLRPIIEGTRHKNSAPGAKFLGEKI
jgi:hypothetical protein